MNALMMLLTARIRVMDGLSVTVSTSLGLYSLSFFLTDQFAPKLVPVVATFD